MATEMTPQERAAAFVQAWMKQSTYTTESFINDVLEHDKQTRRAALMEAAQRANLGDCNSLLDAPCLWCGYNGEGYWQPTTHDLACPWHNVGGRFDRVVALDRLAQEG